jgi:hypothetical protein
MRGRGIGGVEESLLLVKREKKKEQKLRKVANEK